jgi:hypothetical protein
MYRLLPDNYGTSKPVFVVFSTRLIPPQRPITLRGCPKMVIYNGKYGFPLSQE